MVRIIPPAFQNSCIVPVINRKSEAFEEYVCRILFPKEKFILINPSEISVPGTYTFHDPVSGIEFCVECIFRTGLIANSFQPAIHSTDEKLVHFLVLGLGGSASSPNQVFLLKSRRYSSMICTKRYLHGKNIDPVNAISSSQLWGERHFSHFIKKRVA